MDISREFSKQEARERGTWIKLEPEKPDAEAAALLIADWRTGKFSKQYEVELAMAHRRNNIPKTKDLPTELLSEVASRAMFGTLVKDWRGVYEDGKAYPFTLDNFVRLMRDLAVMRLKVQALLREDDLFQDLEGVDQELVGNSSAPSAGS